jgi:hypothetical protein
VALKHFENIKFNSNIFSFAAAGFTPARGNPTPRFAYHCSRVAITGRRGGHPLRAERHSTTCP